MSTHFAATDDPSALEHQVAAVGQRFSALAAELNRTEALAAVLAADFGVRVSDPVRDAVVVAWVSDARPIIERAIAELARSNDLLAAAI